MKLLLYLLTLAVAFAANAQYQLDYEPATHYDHHSKKLKEKVVQAWLTNRGRLNSEDLLADRLYTSRKKWLTRLVDKKVFVADTVLESYCRDVMLRLAHANNLPDIPRLIIIHQTPVPNAACMGRGLYILSTGLLAMLRYEDELAFVLGHEMAHDELNHLNENIEVELLERLSKRTTASLTKVITNKNADEDDIAAVRSLLYRMGSFSQQREYESDEMATMLLYRAGYDVTESVNIIRRLSHGASLVPTPSADMFFQLGSADYPLQAHWFDNRLSIFHERRNVGGYIATDSVGSHPPDSARLAHLEVVTAGYPPAELKSLPSPIDRKALFESFEGAFLTHQYDRGITIGLYLLQEYPENGYVVSRLEAMLSRLYEARGDDQFKDYVPVFTREYAEELLLTNNLLHNLTTAELGELAYHFIHQPGHFNAQRADHQYLLWKICDLTNRTEEKKVMARQFEMTFDQSVRHFKYPWRP